MKQIFKYTLNLNFANSQILKIPSDKILSVENQYEEIVVYAIVDSDLDDNEYEFLIHGTGHILHEDIDNFKFLGTVNMMGGNLMFHIFYKNNH